jgi:hypothetical protein
LLLVALLAASASGVFVKTKDGTIELTELPPDADVYVDGEKATVVWGGGKQKAEVRVKPGTHKIEVKRGDTVVSGESVQVESGGTKVLTARVKPTEVTDPAPPPTAKVKEKTPPGERISHRVQTGTADTGVGPGMMRLMADGDILNRRGLPAGGTWRLSDDGKRLVMKWKNDAAPGGMWVDTYTSENGVMFRGTNNATPPLRLVARLSGPPTEEELADELKANKLIATLRSHTWRYSDPPFPPTDACQFFDDGTFHGKFHWRYWVVGPNEMRVQYDKDSHNWRGGVKFTFNDALTEFTGEFTDEKGKVHRVTGTRNPR